MDIEQKRILDIFSAGNTATILIYGEFLSEILQHLGNSTLIVHHDFDPSDAKHVGDSEYALMTTSSQLSRIAQRLHTDRCALTFRYIHKYTVTGILKLFIDE